MSERRFLFKEVSEYEAIYQPYLLAITESELLKRFKSAMYWAEKGYPLSKSLDILLHGEGKEVTVSHEQFKAVKAAMPSPAPTREEWFQKGRESVLRTNPSGCCCKFDEAGDIVEPCAAHRRWKGKPDLPTPTREEWEMFAHNLANAVYFRADEQTLVKRILSMPIVPKE